MGTRPDSILFYFRRVVTALLALSTPLSEPPVRSSFLSFLSPETLSLAAFIAASLIFVPMLAISTTLLYGVRFYPSTDWLFWLAALLRLSPLVLDVVLDPPEPGCLTISSGVASLRSSLLRLPSPAASSSSSLTLSLTVPWAIF